MWTVARPGQMGYHTRTEYNKRILVLGNGEKWVAKGYGFPYYGDIRNDFLVLSGSLPGAPKRCIALRLPVRPFDENIFKLAEPSHYSIAKQKGAATEEETFKAQKIKLAKEEKKEVKSVEEELKEAAKKAEK
jgi:hypothetical protein